MVEGGAARMPREEVHRLIQSVKWFHSFEVLPGIRTPGFMWHDASRMLDDLKVAKDLSGLDCLYIGAWDGPTAFEMEARGGGRMESWFINIRQSRRTCQILPNSWFDRIRKYRDQVCPGSALITVSNKVTASRKYLF